MKFLQSLVKPFEFPEPLERHPFKLPFSCVPAQDNKKFISRMKRFVSFRNPFLTTNHFDSKLEKHCILLGFNLGSTLTGSTASGRSCTPHLCKRNLCRNHVVFDHSFVVPDEKKVFISTTSASNSVSSHTGSWKRAKWKCRSDLYTLLNRMCTLKTENSLEFSICCWRAFSKLKSEKPPPSSTFCLYEQTIRCWASFDSSWSS